MSNRVSIVVPNYNKGEFVRHSLDSLLKQTCSDWEAIVVDDCSNDGSWDVINDYATKDSRIKCYRNSVNRGGNFSRNFGAREANGEYLIFLDSDDWLSEDCIENRVDEFSSEGNESVDLLVFNMIATKDGKQGGVWNYGDRKNALRSFLRHEICWQTMMPIWRKEAFDRTGGFDERFPRLQDVELHTRALLMGLTYKFAKYSKPDCFYFVDSTRMTSNYDIALTKIVNAMTMYVRKMRGLVRDNYEFHALQETVLSAIRTIGDYYQLGYVSKELRNKLINDMLSSDLTDALVKLYAKCYALNINKIHGFNELFKRMYRVLGCFARYT